ncbi:MAG: response regulator [Campylobacterota bacterium]|nr:response regulator [Campylobacterota bacterium]
MYRLLSVDDQAMNHKVLELDIEEFMEDNELDHKLYSANDGLDAIKKIKVIKPQVIFMDMMMPHISGAETIKCIKVLEDIGDPKIIMVTALGNEETKQKAKEAGAHGFISKPFKYEAINTLLNRCLDLNLDSSDFEDDFFDFEDDGEFSDGTNDLILGQIDNFNETHHNISAKEFLKDYSEIELKHLLEDMNSVTEGISEIIAVLYEDNLEEKKEEISNDILYFSNLLNNFEEFRELSTTLNVLVRYFDNVDYDNVDNVKKAHIANFIKAILSDLINWKENVFVVQDAIDVYYINASMLNSCIQLEALLKKV